MPQAYVRVSGVLYPIGSPTIVERGFLESIVGAAVEVLVFGTTLISTTVETVNSEPQSVTGTPTVVLF